MSSSRMWALNKGDWAWLLMGFVGAVLAGGCAPCEGVFIAQVQVTTYRQTTFHSLSPQRLPLSSWLSDMYEGLRARRAGIVVHVR